MAKKYYLRDVADRDFSADGYELKLEANLRKEVDEKTAKALKKKYDYLELLSD